MKTKMRDVKTGSYSKEFAKAQTEPWILVSSLSETKFSADEIVKLYALRMQVEEAFRDFKSHRYGLGFKHTLTKNIIRLNALMLIATIVNFIVLTVGKFAEQQKWHLKCQSNTSQRRVLSFFTLGFMILQSQYFQRLIENIEFIFEDKYLCLQN